jgi:hypothetical protein
MSLTTQIGLERNVFDASAGERQAGAADLAGAVATQVAPDHGAAARRREALEGSTCTTTSTSA